MRIKLFQNENMQALESEVNAFIQSNSPTTVNVMPIYTTILEESILQGYFAVIVY